MSAPYLEVTFRRGRAFAAYLYLEREPGDKSHHTMRKDPGLVVDFSSDGRPIGIEISAPSQVTAEILNKILRDLDQAPVDPPDLAPLRAA